MFQMMGVPIMGIIENMSGFRCPHCGAEIDIFKVGGGLKAAKEMGLNYLGSLPLDPRLDLREHPVLLHVLH